MRPEVNVGHVNFILPRVEKRPAKRGEGLRQRGNAAGSGKDLSRPRQGPFMLQGAEADIAQEKKRAGARQGPGPRLPAPDDEHHQKNKWYPREIRIEDEEPVELIPVPREGRKKHRSVRSHPVKKDVAHDPRQCKDPQRCPTGGADKSLHQNRDQKGPERSEEKRVRDATVVLDVAHRVRQRKPVAGHKEGVNIGEQRPDNHGRDGGADRFLRSRPPEERPREPVGKGVHATRLTWLRSDGRWRRRVKLAGHTAAMEKLIRLFAAIELSEVARKELEMLPHTIAGARWTRPAQLHLTLRFFGEARPDIAAALRESLGGVRSSAFPLSLAGVNRFPEKRGPRLLLAKVAPEGPLLELNRQIEESTLACGLPPDDKPFSPHITVARFKEPVPRNVIERYLERILLPDTEPFIVTQFVLFSSELRSEGPIYRVESVYPLTGD